MNRIFLLSPAHAAGRRAAMLTRPGANFELALQLQIGAAEIGKVFAFCSGLYFRGKLTYAQHFASRTGDLRNVYVITPTRGLVAAETLVGTSCLQEFAQVPVDAREPRFTEPLRWTAGLLAADATARFILLGSVATGKYLDPLLPVFGERMLFPSRFEGLGDMNRGALLLRAAAANEELVYEPILRARGRSAAKRTGSGFPLRQE